MTCEISELTGHECAQALDALAHILHASVADGASVGFVLPFSVEDAKAFWKNKVFPAVANGDTRLLIARWGGRTVGTVQLGIGLPANQTHRADVAKLLVHPASRRKGIARTLMMELEICARNENRTLLVLDTRSGDPSQILYESLGYQVAGQVPDFCQNPQSKVLESTTFLFKAL